MKLQGKTVCFLGDSITQGIAASTPEKSYVGLFAAAHPQTNVHNCGISGTRIAKQTVPTKPEYEYPFCTRIDAMPENADLVCVFGGTNDFGHGDAPMGVLGDKTYKTFYGGLYETSEKLLCKYPDARIVFFTPLHRAGEGVPSQRKDGRWILADYVEAVRGNAAYWSFPILDLWKVSGIQPALPRIAERFMPDGLHPNDAGHEKLFAVIDAFIATL